MAERIEREEVVEAFRALVLETGAKNPGRLPDTPQVRRANELFGLWEEQEGSLVGDDMMAAIRLRVANYMLFVEAGFDDRSYLGEVADWLVHEQDVAKGESSTDDRNYIRVGEGWLKVEQDAAKGEPSISAKDLTAILEEINTAIDTIGGTEEEYIEEAPEEEWGAL